jgi:hypothetical protein
MHVFVAVALLTRRQKGKCVMEGLADLMDSIRIKILGAGVSPAGRDLNNNRQIINSFFVSPGREGLLYPPAFALPSPCSLLACLPACLSLTTSLIILRSLSRKHAPQQITPMMQ